MRIIDRYVFFSFLRNYLISFMVLIGMYVVLDMVFHFDELVEVDAAVGRVSCESIASYPPGVPALLPGERISPETVAYLRELAASGARLHGASDPAFASIGVLTVDRSDAGRHHQNAGRTPRGGT